MRRVAIRSDCLFERLHFWSENETVAPQDLVNRLANRFDQGTVLFAKIKQRHVHGQIVRHADGLVHRRAWQLRHWVQDVLRWAAIDRIIRNGYSFFHGIAAWAFLVRPFHRFYFLLCRAVRVRTRRFRQGGSQGVCPREIIRGKADTGNCENKEKPLTRAVRYAVGTLRDVPNKNPGKMLRGFLSAEEQEIVWHSRSAKLAGPDVRRENWYLAWEQLQLER